MSALHPMISMLRNKSGFLFPMTAVLVLLRFLTIHGDSTPLPDPFPES